MRTTAQRLGDARFNASKPYGEHDAKHADEDEPRDQDPDSAYAPGGLPGGLVEFRLGFKVPEIFCDRVPELYVRVIEPARGGGEV